MAKRFSKRPCTSRLHSRLTPTRLLAFKSARVSTPRFIIIALLSKLCPAKISAVHPRWVGGRNLPKTEMNAVRDNRITPLRWTAFLVWDLFKALCRPIDGILMPGQRRIWRSCTTVKFCYVNCMRDNRRFWQGPILLIACHDSTYNLSLKRF